MATNRSRRIIALPEVAISTLRAHRERQEHETQGSQIKLARNRYIVHYHTSIGTMLDQRNMLRAFYSIMNTPDPKDPEPDRKKKRKLLPQLRFHDLRHSAATLLLVQGVHPRCIMELLGHASITTTMNTYGHVLEEMKKETARQTDAVFSPAPPLITEAEMIKIV
jgi:integrase